LTQRWVIYHYNKSFNHVPEAGAGWISLSPNPNQTWKIQFINLKKYNYGAGRNLKIWVGGRGAGLTFYKIFEVDNLDNEEISLPNNMHLGTFGCKTNSPWIINYPCELIISSSDMIQNEIIQLTMNLLTNEMAEPVEGLSRFTSISLTDGFHAVWVDEI